MLLPLQLASPFLHSVLAPSYSQELAPCGAERVHKLQGAAQDIINLCSGPDACRELDQVIEQAYIELLATRLSDTLHWRRLYSDACVLLSLSDLISPPVNEETATSCIKRLDHALIIAGAPGQHTQTLIHELILRIQDEHLPAKPYVHTTTNSGIPTKVVPTRAPILPTSSHPIPRRNAMPSLTAFQRELSNRPFILPGFASDWPAMNEHPWRSIEYLRSVAGRGRVVPVEVGADYSTDDWTQSMMSWDDFLDGLEKNSAHQQKILYMAQHNLLSQFPVLREDIMIPDYVYTALSPPPEYPSYRAPSNEEELVLNAWLGPSGTVSPAHTDPFFNFYVQVVGRKTVWLAPSAPHVTDAMYPYPPTSSSLTAGGEHTHNPAANQLAPSMSNTTQVDVFSDQDKDTFPLFWEHAVPEALSETLEPGDVLFFPPGWWHAMRSEETSFSVSMWF
ncbi:Clavaminate synthase-like protein [Gloeopeniophorella convolvens]|nr:Clavaminate synthase-like protein [Gloeopeniophorella convolvens]